MLMLLLQQPTSLAPTNFPPSSSCPSYFRRRRSHKSSFSYFRRLPSISSSCSSTSKPPPALRAAKSRKTKSNEELCDDIRDFVSAFGFPQGYLPSYNDFSLHGRQDLANIVRRRGYKLVRELLASSMTDVRGSGDNEIMEERVETSASESGLTDQGKDKKSLDGDASSSSELSITHDHSSCLTFDHALGVKDESCTSVEEPTISSLQEKVAKFIQDGELETVEGVEDGNEFSESPIPALVGTKSKFATEEQTDLGNSGTHTATALNGNSASSSKCVVHSSLENGTLSCKMECSASDELASAGSQADLDIEARTKENEIEIKRIKFMLHQKELELSHLKQQVEKEKQALAELQIKAEAEISKAQQLILDKDAELQAAGESLAGLKEVQIEYFGDGENVEVAGSFNGWHQRIKMDPQPFSNIKNSGELRNSRLWRSVLWLYPGRYEIKFIVDGEWKVDPQRETVNFGNIHNNILHVPK